MQQACRLMLAAFAIITGVVSGLQAGSAQEATGFGQPQFFVTPYIPLFGVYAKTTTGLARAPEVNSSVGPFELLGHLDGVPMIGSAEIRDGPISLLGDVLHVPVETAIATRNVFYQGGQAALIANTGTALLLYRVLAARTNSPTSGAASALRDLAPGWRSTPVSFQARVSSGGRAGAIR